jgi:sortase A
MREMTSNSPINTRKAEHIFLAIGLALLAIWAGAQSYNSWTSRAAIERFQANAAAAPGTGNGALEWDGSIPDSATDFTLWNPKRVVAYKDSLSEKTDLPLAILRIPKIKLVVPVFNGTDELTLNRGVGRILGTAQNGQRNFGIAGHRDGFFRGLKDVGRDDIVELVLAGRTDQYVITKVQIVNPEDVSVLASTPTPTLTLVTCFPFYYVGNAPRRYVVTASYRTSRGPHKSVSGNSLFTSMKTSNKEKQDEVN